MGSLQEGDKQEKHMKAHNDTSDPQHSQPALHSFPTRRSSDLASTLLRARGPRPFPVRARPHSRHRSRCRGPCPRPRSEEHTSELQSPDHLVCRLLLEKKKNKSEKKIIYKL